MPKLSCIAPLLQHPDVVNQSLNVVHVAVPKVTGRNEKSVCGVQSIHKHPTHPLKSESALKKSNFVKQHIMRGAGGCWDGEAVELLGTLLLHLRTPSFTKDHAGVSYKTHPLAAPQVQVLTAPQTVSGSWTLHTKDLNHL